MTTVYLPENISDITLEQYKKFAALKEMDELKLNKKKVEIFAGISKRRINQIKQKDFQEMVAQIDLALTQDSEFQAMFKMGGVEFGFIPNFDKITAGEWGDLSKYNTEIETMDRLMAILFRPIVNIDNFGNYKIEPYNGTEKYAEKMLQTPMNIVQGALVFFYNLAKELQIAINQFTEEELKKVKVHQTFFKDGVGTLHSLN